MTALINITGVDHTSYTVSNMERSLYFYRDLLGFTLLWQREASNQYLRDIVGFPDCVIKQAHLRIPNSTHKLELFEYVQPHGTAPIVSTNNPGSSHLSLIVDDLPAAYENLSKEGVQFRSAPVYIDVGANTGGYALYMLDPDGITVELFQLAKR